MGIITPILSSGPSGSNGHSNVDAVPQAASPPPDLQEAAMSASAGRSDSRGQGGEGADARHQDDDPRDAGPARDQKPLAATSKGSAGSAFSAGVAHAARPVHGGGDASAAPLTNAAALAAAQKGYAAARASLEF